MYANMYTKEDGYERSIILVGPVGSGKTLLSEELKKATGLPVITMDLLRHCPSKEKLKNQIAEIRNRIGQVEGLLQTSADNNENLKEELQKLKNSLWVAQRRQEMREILPNVPNYEDMGFNEDISRKAEEFGPIAWHFYQKQFENQLLKAVMEQVDRPCIFDMGGGMAVSLDRDYEILAKEFKEKDEDLFRKTINMDQIGFHHIKEALSPFRNVVELIMSDEYRAQTDRAKNDRLNEAFISTGQYGEAAKRHVCVDRIATQGKVDTERVSQIAKSIANPYKLTR